LFRQILDEGQKTVKKTIHGNKLIKQTVHKRVSHGCIFLILSLLVLPAVSVAQQYYDPGLIQKTVDRTPAEYAATGVRMGSFTLKPGAELAWVNNDNIYYLEKSVASDNVFYIRPWLNLLSDWSRHSFNIRLFAEFGRYQDFDTENYEDWRASIDGRFDVMRNSAFSYYAAYMNLHEDRSSPDDSGGITPTRFDYYGYDLGYGHTFNRLTAKLNYREFFTDYDDNVMLDGEVIDLQDRDRKRDEWALRLDYGLASGKTALIAGASVNYIDYDQVFDSDGYMRSSKGHRYFGGVSLTITSLLIGDVYATYAKQDYDDPFFADVDGWGFGAALNWTPTEATNVNFRLETTPQETIQSGSSGYMSYLYAVRIQQDLRRNFMGNLRFSYTDNKYETNGGDDDSLQKTNVFRAEIGLSYLFNPFIYVSGGYAYTQQKANVNSYEYSTNRWFVTLGLQY
jgi:hypothetical protein